MATARRRLDTELVRRGLCPSREAAQDAIARGLVTVGGAPASKPARLVAVGDAVVVAGSVRGFVSRGGDKLEAGLERFGLDVTGQRAVDAGASTGGFTDCLLQRGAREVVALDVGHGQLDAALRADPRVVVLERCNVRRFGADPRPGAAWVAAPARSDEIGRRVAEGDHLEGAPAALVVADLSFISLRSVAGALVALGAPGASLLVLVKPQFEAGRAEVSAGRGVIRDPSVWSDALHAVIAAFTALGATIMGVMPSPLRGARGNTEFLLWLRAPDSPWAVSPASSDVIADMVLAAVSEAEGTGPGAEGAAP